MLRGGISCLVIEETNDAVKPILAAWRRKRSLLLTRVSYIPQKSLKQCFCISEKRIEEGTFQTFILICGGGGNVVNCNREVFDGLCNQLCKVKQPKPNVPFQTIGVTHIKNALTFQTLKKRNIQYFSQQLHFGQQVDNCFQQPIGIVYTI